MNAVNRDSCHPLSKELNILPLYYQYIFSLSTFAVKNRDAFIQNSAIHSINTRQDFDLHPPTINLSNTQKAAYYCGIKIFSNLPLNIKQLSHDSNRFKLALKKFILAGSFYHRPELFEWNLRSDLGNYQQRHSNVIVIPHFPAHKTHFFPPKNVT